MRASSESGGKALLQFSQVGLSSSMTGSFCDDKCKSTGPVRGLRRLTAGLGAELLDVDAIRNTKYGWCLAQEGEAHVLIHW